MKSTQQNGTFPTFDWETGIYQIQVSADGKSTFRITLASDWGALWDYEQIMHHDPLAVYGDLLPILQASDLNIVNVECALGEKGAPIPKGGPNLRSAGWGVRNLTEVPFHIACLANNHTMDFGLEGLEETIAILQNAGIQTVGAGKNGAAAAQPLVVSIKDITLGIINCAEGEDGACIANGPGAHPFDVPALTMQIRQLKQEVDAVLVVFHGGREMAPLPPPYVVDGLRQLAEAGACAIIGHHPHVPQGIEIHHDVPIAYSQGNFVFRWAERDANFYALNTGYLVHLDFAGKNLAKFSITPYRTKREDVFLLQGKEKTQLLEELKYLSALLADPLAIEHAWNAFVDVHGEEGMFGTIQWIMDLAKTDQKRAAAIFHNLFFCPAHSKLYLNGMKRLSRGTLGNSPQWAQDLVKDWGMRLL